MKTPMEVFKTHFEQGMTVRDFEAFKRQYPTLLKVIIKSMEDYASSYSEPEGRKTETYVRVPGGEVQVVVTAKFTPDKALSLEDYKPKTRLDKE